MSAAFNNSEVQARRNMLSLWIKMFVWVFMLLGSAFIFCLIFDLFGIPAGVGLYGIQTCRPLSILGLAIVCTGVLKATAAFGLWNGKRWAIKLAINDAVLGLIICFFTMLWALSKPDSGITAFRLEVFFLVPYLLKMISIKDNWERVNVV